MRLDYHKLVRDEIPRIIEAGGGQPVTRVLDQAGYLAALRAKLVGRPRKRRRHRTGSCGRNWRTCWKFCGRWPLLTV